MEQKKFDVEGSIQFAYFLRYGYIALFFISLIIVSLLNISKFYYFITLSFLVLDSTHHIVASYLFSDHFICYMQSMRHSVMDPTIRYNEREIKKMKKDGYVLGIILLVFGLLFTAIILFGF